MIRDDFSDFLIFADESGDHGLANIDPQFPAFALTFCIMSKDAYWSKICPAIQNFKFRYWGHDAVILHEHELRKSEGPFAFLRTDKALRERFMGELAGIVEQAPFDIIAAVIRKDELRKLYSNPWNPYEIALQFCLERLLLAMADEKQAGKLAHVIFESRGRREDGELELAFRRICDNRAEWGRPYNLKFGRHDGVTKFGQIRFEPIFLPKASNSAGLQLADLTARPVALKSFRTDQPNRAYELIAKKLTKVKIFP